jgi:hypothetical protein
MGWVFTFFKTPVRLFTDPKQWKGVCTLLRALWRRLLCVLRIRRCARPCRDPRCLKLPEVYRRPDPLIYAQFYLMKQGLAVTWNNPDIELFEPGPGGPSSIGAAVASSKLQPNHVYRVRIRVWNGSYDAPVVGLPVRLSYLSFGAGTKSHAVGTAFVDLGVKGSPHCPAYAFIDWKTPATKGHYCLQARLEWSDDANPNNNLGQENTNVGKIASPAVFQFALRNHAGRRRRFALEPDTYRLPDPTSCDDSPYAPQGERTRLEESRARWEIARGEHGADLFPVPDDWTVTIEPAAPILDPGEEVEINVAVDLPTATGGTPAALNVNAFALDGEQRALIGGVTFHVEKA